MAKKRKKHSTHRRHRVSGTGKADLQAVGLAVVGAVLNNKVTAMLKGKTGILGTIAPYSGLAIGYALPMVSKSPMVKQIAMGFMVGGGLETLKQLAPGLVGGSYQLSVISGRNRMNGGVKSPNMVGAGAGYSPARNSVYDNLSVISGMTATGM